MKKIVSFLLLFSFSAFAIDCHRIFTISAPINCSGLTSTESKKEDQNLITLLKRKIDPSDLKNNIAFVKKHAICSDELRSIQDYSNFNFRIYNPALRSNKAESIDESYQKDICLISKGLDKIPRYQRPVFRGMSLKKEIAHKYLKIGNRIEEKSFVSTDKNLSTAIGFSRSQDKSDVRIVLKFQDPIGHEIKNLSLNPLEDEVLIDKGHTFIVSSVEKMIDGSEYYFVVLRNF